jgi:uncharacterized protein (DUF1778 family)
MVNELKPKKAFCGFKIEQEIYELIRAICKSRGEDISDFMRRAVKRELGRLNYLSEEELKALEMSNCQKLEGEG